MPYQEKGMHLNICKDGIELDGYGPQFDEEELDSLKKLGWRMA